MKYILSILFITISTLVFAQAETQKVKSDTIVIKLTPFQQQQLADIDKKKEEILKALEKQRADLYAQLDERSNLIVLMVFDANKIDQAEIQSLEYKKGSLFITKKKKP